MCWIGNISLHLVSFAAFLFSNIILNKILGLKDFEVTTFTANKAYNKINMVIRNGFSLLR